jgi:hypothetical protein
MNLAFLPGEGLLDTRDCGPGSGVERIVGLPVAAPGRVEARLEAPSGGVALSVRTACDAPESELACTAPDFGAARLLVDVDAPQTLWFVAEGGAFEPAERAVLTVAVWPPTSPAPVTPNCPAADAPSRSPWTMRACPSTPAAAPMCSRAAWARPSAARRNRSWCWSSRRPRDSWPRPRTRTRTRCWVCSPPVIPSRPPSPATTTAARARSRAWSARASSPGPIFSRPRPCSAARAWSPRWTSA